MFKIIKLIDSIMDFKDAKIHINLKENSYFRSDFTCEFQSQTQKAKFGQVQIGQDMEKKWLKEIWKHI